MSDVVGILVALALLIVAVVGTLQCNLEFTRVCEQRGGHVKSLGGKGKLCLSADGRVIEWDN